MQSETFPFWLPRAISAGDGGFAVKRRTRAGAAVAPFRSGSSLVVEALEFDAAEAHVKAWRELAERALEVNIFNEPACALTAAQHLSGANRPRFAFVWEKVGDRPHGELVGLCPLQVPGRFDGRALLHTWRHEQAPLATPLFDARCAAAAAAALIGFCAERQPRAAGIVFHGLLRGGATAALLERWAHLSGRNSEVQPAPASTCLRVGAVGQSGLRSAAGLEVATLAPARRSLERLGVVAFDSLRHPSDVRFGTEAFLALDATSHQAAAAKLLGRVGLTTFTRSLTRRLAAEGKCRIDRLSVGGKAIVMAIVLTSGQDDYLWRIACDPGFDPSMLHGQLVLGMLRSHRGRSLLLADARGERQKHALAPLPLAAIWPGERPVVDVAVATAPIANRAFAAALRRNATFRRVLAGLQRFGAIPAPPVAGARP